MMKITGIIQGKNKKMAKVNKKEELEELEEEKEFENVKPFSGDTFFSECRATEESYRVTLYIRPETKKKKFKIREYDNEVPDLEDIKREYWQHLKDGAEVFLTAYELHPEDGRSLGILKSTRINLLPLTEKEIENYRGVLSDPRRSAGEDTEEKVLKKLAVMRDIIGQPSDNSSSNKIAEVLAKMTEISSKQQMDMMRFISDSNQKNAELMVSMIEKQSKNNDFEKFQGMLELARSLQPEPESGVDSMIKSMAPALVGQLTQLPGNQQQSQPVNVAPPVQRENSVNIHQAYADKLPDEVREAIRKEVEGGNRSKVVDTLSDKNPGISRDDLAKIIDIITRV